MSTDPLPDKIPDSITDMQTRGRRFRAESAAREAAQAAQEQHQRNRQMKHQEEARKIDEEMRAHLFMRVMKMREESKPPAEVPPVPVYTQRQDEQLAAEQAAGRRALEKYAKRSEAARVSTEEKDTVPGFKVG